MILGPFRLLDSLRLARLKTFRLTALKVRTSRANDFEDLRPVAAAAAHTGTPRARRAFKRLLIPARASLGQLEFRPAHVFGRPRHRSEDDANRRMAASEVIN